MNIRLAEPKDAAAVSGVLSAAASKLRDRGDELWTEQEVSEPTVAQHVADGLYYLGRDAGEAVGVFRYQFTDRAFWPEIPEGTSAYLHKLAIVPDRQGSGLAEALLHHAVALTRERGLLFLRLDCVSGRPKLRAVYEDFGFKHHSRVQLGNTLFERFEFDASPHA